MVRDLLEGFVQGDWLAALDYASLQIVDGNYISKALRQRTNDVVWRLQWGKQSLYIYLALEFQSTVDRYMAVRVMTYTALLYEKLIDTRALAADRLLPPVLPIVLYNGSRRWNAVRELTTLIRPGPPSVQMYCPQLRYLLIDEARYRDSELAPMHNLVAALFRLENSRSSVQIGEVLSALVQWLSAPEENGLRDAFFTFAQATILRKIPEAPAHEIHDLTEMRTMVASLSHEWKAKAHREGRRKGRREGEAALLLRLLRKRFGELPDWVRVRLEQATTERLEQWGEDLLQADSLDTLLGSEEPR